jgi:hypothetical protein
MNNNNPFGVTIPTDNDLMDATPIAKREIVEAGIYYAIITGMEFKKSQSGLPMIVVDFNIVLENNQSVVNIKDYWMLASSKPEYKPSIFSKLAGLFECWNVPKEKRSTQYFTWIPAQGEDPASKLIKCINNYASITQTNTSYIAKKMVRLSIDKTANSYTDKTTGVLREGFNNSIVAFIPLESIPTNTSNNNNNVNTDNSYNDKSNNATTNNSNNNDDPFADFN